TGADPDPDGGSLTYLLEYSPDGGVHWQPVVLDWTDACYTVDLASLPAASAGRIRIVASDGYNTGIPVEHQAPFVIADAGPQITLTHGRVVCDLEAGQQFLMSAWAQDVEDGAIPSGDITWRDAGDQVLGSGEVMVALTEPTMYFSVTAVDSGGHPARQEVILNQPTGVGDDADCDGMPAGYEQGHGLNPGLHDAAGDLDQDLLTNLAEYRTGSDPADPDTDGDGRLDGNEVASGTNPMLHEGVIIQILNNLDD
ncbi:MAG TPA: hypothetical protein VJN91_05700, partial [Gammaproteobacteria bacterium]|nr:hypothetical protein [Gammaproteobacteria bacterium]